MGVDGVVLDRVDLGDHRLRRLLRTMGPPVVVWLLIGLGVASRVPVADFLAVSACLGISSLAPMVPLLVFAVRPVFERIEHRAGGVVRIVVAGVVRREFEISIAHLRAAALLGGSVHLVPRGSPTFVVRVPRHARADVDRLLRNVAAQIESVGGDLPPILDRSVVETTHDGVRLQLDPVFTPVPLWLTLTLWLALAYSVALPMVMAMLKYHFAGILIIGALVAPAALSVPLLIVSLRSRVLGIELAIRGPRLLVRYRSQIRVWDQQVALTDVEFIDVRPGRLTIGTRTGRVSIPLVDRSAATTDAVHRFVETHVLRTESRRGTVPVEIRQLTAQSREPPR